MKFYNNACGQLAFDLLNCTHAVEQVVKTFFNVKNDSQALKCMAP